jgi:putative superfamily III holin-X
MQVSGPPNPGPPDDFAVSLSESITELTGNVQTAGDLLSGIAQDVSKLVRLEIELAKQEIVELAKTKAMALGLSALGAVLGFFIVPFVLLTVFELFALWMPRWVAALLVTVLIAAVCAVVFLVAKKKFEGDMVPKRTVASVKESVAWAKRLKR